MKPHDAELAVLSIVLQNPSKVFELQSLKPYMFSSTPNQLIMGKIDEVVNSGNLPELNLIATSLFNSDKLNDAGGKEYIDYLSTLDFIADNLNEYERIVVSSFKKRKLSESLIIAKENLTDNSQVDGVISMLRKSLDNLTLVQGGEGTVSFYDALKHNFENLISLIENPKLPGEDTGFPILNNITGGFLEGDLWIIAGRPSMGKTAWLCNSSIRTAEKGNPCLVISREMNTNKLATRYLAIKTGVPINNLRLGALTQKQLNTVTETIDKIKELPIHIDPSYNTDLNYIMQTVRKYKRLYDIRIVYLDYIQLLAERGLDSTHELGKISREFKLISNDLGITSVLFSQLNRLVELREDKRPLLSDLRQSGNLEEDADIVSVLYRDEVYHPETKDKGILENIIRKNRDGELGTIINRIDLPSNFIQERD